MVRMKHSTTSAAEAHPPGWLGHVPAFVCHWDLSSATMLQSRQEVNWPCTASPFHLLPRLEHRQQTKESSDVWIYGCVAQPARGMGLSSICDAMLHAS